MIWLRYCLWHHTLSGIFTWIDLLQVTISVLALSSKKPKKTIALASASPLHTSQGADFWALVTLLRFHSK